MSHGPVVARCFACTDDHGEALTPKDIENLSAFYAAQPSVLSSKY